MSHIPTFTRIIDIQPPDLRQAPCMAFLGQIGMNEATQHFDTDGWVVQGICELEHSRHR